MNNLNKEMHGFYNKNVYYTNRDSLYIKRKYWNVSDIAGLVGFSLCQRKTDYKSGGIFYGLFLAPKMKYCSTFNECGILDEHKTFKGFNDSKKLLDCSQYFKTIESKEISAMLPKTRKKLFNSGVVIPA